MTEKFNNKDIAWIQKNMSKLTNLLLVPKELEITFGFMLALKHQIDSIQKVIDEAEEDDDINVDFLGGRKLQSEFLYTEYKMRGEALAQQAFGISFEDYVKNEIEVAYNKQS